MTAPETFHDGRVTLWPGDCLATLDAMPENSVDAVCTDPPYHLHSIVKRFAKAGRTESTSTKSGPHQRTATGFMGKQWDGGDIAFRPETWAKVLRVLKPGGYIVAFSSSRTFGRMSVAIEDAGFVTHPMIGDLLSQNEDIARFIASLSHDQLAAFCRIMERNDPVAGLLFWIFGSGFPKATRIQAPGYEGQRYGAQALKPALEPIYVGQKPFSEATGTANILRWGTGALRIDDCRVEGEKTPAPVGQFRGSEIGASGLRGVRDGSSDRLGRWPPNLVHDGSPEVLALFPESGGQQGALTGKEPSGTFSKVASGPLTREPFARRNESGSAARFFPAFPQTEADCAWYGAKADSEDRLGSKHPTIKPLDLMRWLVRLHCLKGGLVLDPFAGTGTTGHAALIEGCRAVLCEADPEHCDDIRRRMGLVYAGRDERARRLATRAETHGPLFADAAE